MKKKKSFLPAILVIFPLALIIFVLASFGLLSWVGRILDPILIPIAKVTYGLGHNKSNEVETIKSLRLENEQLRHQLVEVANLKKENSALRDQFQTTTLVSSHLLPASIIGERYVPGGGPSDILVIDRGKDDGVMVGQAVVVKDNLIGRITKVSSHLSSVMRVTSDAFLITGKTVHTNAQGVVVGRGDGKVNIENVQQSFVLENDDVVVTRGDIDEKGDGVPPNLIIGKIESVDKKPSDLFQKASLDSKISLLDTAMVFVITKIE